MASSDTIHPAALNNDAVDGCTATLAIDDELDATGRLAAMLAVVRSATWNSANISSKSSSTSSLFFFLCFGILHTVGNAIVG
jgi:hypothetical protein